MAKYCSKYLYSQYEELMENLITNFSKIIVIR